ncbi:MAG: efflux RND transporter periplasmic adaptor subunit [Culturomica sp.]|jgi:RND family efflux transporter MFP subunit|nr:efflux RND transporter periplasmic adaptor subunit [Culturomica sp.]
MQGNRFTEAEEQPAEVKVLRLERRDFNYELISNGTVMAMHKAELRFPSQDMVQKIYVRNGERVTAGQKIAEQDKFRVEMAMKQAREALEQAKLDLQDALIGQGFAWSDSLNIPAEVMRIARIRSNYDYCLNQFTNSRHQFEEATLVAPFSGVVANIVVKEYNLPGGNPFCTIIDNQHPEVVFSVLENELPLINPGDRLLLSPFSQPDYTVEGRITEINPVIDRNGMVRVKASVSNRDNRFYEGMNVKVRVQRLLGDRLVIPKSALLLRNNRKVVFTLKGDRAQWVYVETAQENTDSYVVTEKLQAGDSVIYEGNLHLAHEAQVVVVN